MGELYSALAGAGRGARGDLVSFPDQNTRNDDHRLLYDITIDIRLHYASVIADVVLPSQKCPPGHNPLADSVQGDIFC